MKLGRLRSAAVALLLLLGVSSAVASASVRDQLVARWVDANDVQIAAIKNAKQRASAQAAFAKLSARIDEPVAAQSEPPDMARVAARELAIPGRYQLSIKIAPPPSEPWYQVVWDQLVKWFKPLKDALFGRIHLGPGGAVAIGDVLVGLAVLALLFAAIRLLAEFQIVRRSRAAAIEALGAPQDARKLYERAHAAALDGDFAAASRLLFAATVVALDLRGVVAEDPSATVGDLRRALRSREAALLAPFDAVAAPFVASTYAERPVATAEWERARDAFLTVAPEREAT